MEVNSIGDSFMIAHQCFVDSNIIVYAHDRKETVKYPIASQCLRSFWETGPLFPSISIQVLQETFAVFMNKKVSFDHARNIIELYCQWNVIDNDKDVLQQGMRIKQKYQISIWDGLIVAAAIKAKVKYIVSEDFNPNQDYEGIKIINPFAN